jgi:hypothetical protein
MAAGLGFKEFTTGDVLTAADANGYLASQVVMVFASDAARTSAITSPQEGMISFRKDADALEYYSGAAWVAVDTGTSPLTTKGDLFTFSTVNARLGVGANGTVLTADSAEATGLKWASSASSKFIQTVSTQTGAVATGSTAVPLDDTIPQNTEGTQFMSLSITPTSATNRLLIQVVANVTAASINALTTSLFVDSTADALATTYAVNRAAGDNFPIVFNHNMVAGSTSAMEFKVRCGGDGGATVTFNGSGGVRRFGGVFASSITITEYTP